MINIAIALNKNALIQAYVTLYSMSVNHIGQDVDVYVLHSELDESDINFLSQAVEKGEGKHNLIVKYIDPGIIPDLPYNTFWSVETYYRLLLTNILPEDIDRILYLDIDMVVNKNISDFYKTDFEGAELIVSEDMEFHNILAINDENHRRHTELFQGLIDEGMVYFCAGMILYNVKLLRERKYTFEYYMQVFKEKSDCFTLNDQDLLNYVHWKNVKHVDNRKYGIFASTAHSLGYTYDDVKSESYIIHFTGAAKPWTVNLLRYDIEKIWWEYASVAPFYFELMEQVFFNTLESSFTEDYINNLIDENGSLREIVQKFEEIMKKLS